MASITQLEARVAAIESAVNKLYDLVNTCASGDTMRSYNAIWQKTLDDIQESIVSIESRLQIVENAIRGL